MKKDIRIGVYIMKKGIISIGMSAAAVIAISAGLVIGKQNLLRTNAGLTASGANRTLVFDHNSEVHNEGSPNDFYVLEGNMKLRCATGYASNDGGLMRMYATSFFCYNEVNSDNIYYGFEQATVTSISMTYKLIGEETSNYIVRWIGFSENSSDMEYNPAKTNMIEGSISASEEYQTITWNTGDFFTNQEDEKTYGKGCGNIMISTLFNQMGTYVAIKNFTITYTCK